MDKYKESYSELAHNSGRLIKSAPEVMKANGALTKEVLKDGHLPIKTKELISLGIAISARCEGCMLAHVRNAVNAGASKEELVEVIEVAILMGGGPSIVYGGKALSIAESFFG